MHPVPFGAITPCAGLNARGCDTTVAPRRRMKRLVEAAGIEETRTGFAKPLRDANLPRIRLQPLMSFDPARFPSGPAQSRANPPAHGNDTATCVAARSLIV